MSAIERERERERQPNYNIITHTETLSFDIRERERDSHATTATPGGWAGTVDAALWPLWTLEVNSVVGRRQHAKQIPRVAF